MSWCSLSLDRCELRSSTRCLCVLSSSGRTRPDSVSSFNCVCVLVSTCRGRRRRRNGSGETYPLALGLGEPPLRLGLGVVLEGGRATPLDSVLAGSPLFAPLLCGGSPFFVLGSHVGGGGFGRRRRQRALDIRSRLFLVLLGLFLVLGDLGALELQRPAGDGGVLVGRHRASCVSGLAMWELASLAGGEGGARVLTRRKWVDVCVAMMDCRAPDYQMRTGHALIGRGPQFWEGPTRENILFN